jgi:hypothetical protein
MENTMPVNMQMAYRQAVVAVSRVCFYCKKRATHADHIHPTKAGGPDHPANMIASCAKCNCTKGKKRLAPDLEREAKIQAFILDPVVREVASRLLHTQNTAKPAGLRFADAPL